MNYDKDIYHDSSGNRYRLTTINDEDYISLTDIIKAKDGDFFISDWLRNRNTLEYLGAWESMFNPDFNYGEFATIKSKAGLNNFKISIKEWHEKTNAIGIVARAGRYGGTYAHKDIAFNFCMWISPVFQLYVVREYQRLVELERSELALSWNVKRLLSKANYHIHTYYAKFKEFRTISARLSIERPDIVVISSQNMTGISVPLRM